MAYTQPARIVESTAEDYHADLSRVSRSMLVDFIESPWLYYRRYVKRDAWQKQSTKAMDTGTLFHAAMLEGKSIYDLVHVIPASVLNADGHCKGKAYTDWKACHTDKPCRKAAELDDEISMFVAMSKSEAAQEILGNPAGINEVTIHWDWNGIQRRTRLDRFIPGIGISDIKTSRVNSLDAINNSIEYDGYYLQAADYQMAVEALTGETLPFSFLFQPKSPPFATVTVDVDQDWIDDGRAVIEAALARLQVCGNSSDWRDPVSTQRIRMSRPNSAKYRWQLTESAS